jgi:hypothetical protein
MSQFSKYLEIIQERKDYNYNEGIFGKELDNNHLELLEKLKDNFDFNKSNKQTLIIRAKTNFTKTFGFDSETVAKLCKEIGEVIKTVFSFEKQESGEVYITIGDVSNLRTFLHDKAKEISGLSGKMLYNDEALDKIMKNENVNSPRYKILFLHRFL